MNLEQLKQLLAQGLITPEAYHILSAQAPLDVSGSRIAGSINTGEMKVGGDFVGRDKIINNHYHGEPTEDPAEALKIYCQLILRQCGDLPLRGLDIQESEAGNKEKAIGLAQVYVDLDTTSRVRLTKQEKEAYEKRGKQEDTRPVTALEALQQNQKLVLLGDPGGGKSTFVSHLAYCLAAHHLYPTEKWLAHLPGWIEKNRQVIPLLVILRDFAQFEPEGKLTADSPERLWQFIKYRLHNMGIGFAEKAIRDKLAKGEMVVLLDGLDEVTTSAQRLMVKQAVEGFMALYGANRYVLTCRILSYQAPDSENPEEKELRFTNLPEFTLAPFSEEKINQFIEAWYTELAQQRQLENPALKIERLKEAVNREDIRELAPNPLLLTIMALVHTHKGELPAARVLLYEDCIDMLLWKWEQKKGDNQPALQQWLERYKLDKTDFKQLLRRLAYEAHAQGTEGRGVVGIAEMTLLKELMKLTQKDANGALEMIGLMKHRAGLLLERSPEVFTFPHRTFQEYLAGGHLANQAQFSKQADKLVTQNWGLWREAIKLAAGRLIHAKEEMDPALMLVDNLTAEEDEAGTPFDQQTYWRKVWLAGEVLIELGLNRVERDRAGRTRLKVVRKKLEELVSTGQLEPKERLLAGELLGEIGDSRPGVGVIKVGELEIPDIEFCYIPPGPFLMGSSEEDEEAEEHEKPQHLLDISYGYWLCKYLVTVGQYRAFVQVTGHPHTDPDRLRGLPNQPVNNVTWHEALKFCGWLTEISQVRGWLPEGYKIILPSEAEWEKGARGGLHWPIKPLPSQSLGKGLVEPTCQLQAEAHPIWRYPWGNEFDTDCALTEETGFNGRGVVGAYPRGRSPYGLWDMSGNLWEWTRSIYRAEYSYRYQFKDGREDLERPDTWSRVVRGGGYFWNAQNVRSASRSWFGPSYRSVSSGFRLCVSPKRSAE